MSNSVTNQKFILKSDLQSLFRDKDTGLPLAYGKVYFYSQNDESTPKYVYQLSGSLMAGYTYTALPNPITLSSIGTVQDDLGNDILLYWYPYLGDPNDDSDTIENYYVRVYNQNAVFQFDRHYYPNQSGDDVSENDQINYVPNGQFLSYYDATAQFQETINLGTVSLDVHYIAPGGWTREDQTGAGGTYTSTFISSASGAAYLKDFPPNTLVWQCTSTSVGVHQVGVKWYNVGTFSGGTNLGQTQFTFFLNGVSADGGTYTFDVYITKYYGTGGSTTETFTAGQVELSPIGGYKSVLINNFGDNTGKTVGAGNYIQVSLRPATNTTFKVNITDVGLSIGNVSITTYPPKTSADTLSEGVAGFMPIPATDGSDFYLPLILTPQGMKFDDSIVGQIIGKPTATAVDNELFMNGTSYVASAYSNLGIPYSRLANYLIAGTPAISITDGGLGVTATLDAGASNGTIPMWGTGANFVTCYNKSGSVGTVFLVQLNTVAAGVVADGGTPTGWTLAALSANRTYQWTVTGVPTAGMYWTFTDGSVGHVYNVWYSVDNAGTAPATPTGANIEVKLVTGDTIASTITKTLKAVNQYQFTLLDARGYFWRGLDATGTIDTGAATRAISTIAFGTTTLVGANSGSLEADAYLNHTHTASLSNAGHYLLSNTGTDSVGGGGNINTNNTPTVTVDASTTGSTETRPKNLALNWFIKY